jgi:hypothetical protein
VQSFRLIYEVQGDTVDVLAFVHAARDLAAWWEREQAGGQGEQLGGAEIE